MLTMQVMTPSYPLLDCALMEIQLCFYFHVCSTKISEPNKPSDVNGPQYRGLKKGENETHCSSCMLDDVQISNLVLFTRQIQWKLLACSPIMSWHLYLQHYEGLC